MDLIQLIRVDERSMTCVEGWEMQSADTNQNVLLPPPLPFCSHSLHMCYFLFCHYGIVRGTSKVSFRITLDRYIAT